MSYSLDLSTGLVSGSLSAVLGNLTTQTEQLEVLCCVEGILRPQDCGNGDSCLNICGENRAGRRVRYIVASHLLQFLSGKVIIVNIELVSNRQICSPADIQISLNIPIYQISYCPWKVTTVAALKFFPVCCLHPAVWRNVGGVKEKCCSEYSFCV